MPADDRGPTPVALGWDAAWDAAFLPFVGGGRRPARVLAVHKETAIVRDERGVERPAIVTGQFRFEALGPSDYPAVGDWVVLDDSAANASADDPAVISAVVPRRSAFVRSAADANRRTAGNLVDEQVIAANVDVAFLVAGLDGDFNLRRMERYLAVAWASRVMPVAVLNKADIGLDTRGSSRRHRGDRAGRADRHALGADRGSPGRPRAVPAARDDRSRARVVGRRASPRS